mgnify:CR=1 FL=1|jgi:hypothetical protein
MPIDRPLRRPNIGGKPTTSEFVICQNFVFRPAAVDGFSHQTYEDNSAVTIVNFKGYTQSISDSEGRLFDFLKATFNPGAVDENS